MPSLVNDQHQRAGSLILGLAGLLGEFRVNLVNHAGRRDPAANVENSAAGSAAFAGAEAWPMARSHTTAAAGTDTAARSGAVRRQCHVCHRVTNVRHTV